MNFYDKYFMEMHLIIEYNILMCKPKKIKKKKNNFNLLFPYFDCYIRVAQKIDYCFFNFRYSKVGS